jgi:hypothetical protein
MEDWGPWGYACKGVIGKYIPGRNGMLIGENGPGGWEGRNSDYNYGLFRFGIWECRQFECEGGIVDYFQGRVGRRIGENEPGGWEVRSRFYLPKQL